MGPGDPWDDQCLDDGGGVTGGPNHEGIKL